MKILIIHEALPRPDLNGSDVCFMQTIKELVAQGHELTYLARHGVGRERYTLPLEQLGIKVYSHDFERLRRFGAEAAQAWTFEAVLKDGHFDLAILSLWFWRPVSVPEDYLSAIRLCSPRTRVAVITYDQHGLREHRLAELTGLWTDRERAHDFKQREVEIYGRADMVLAVSESDRLGLSAAFPDLEVEVLPMVAESSPSVTDFAGRANLLFLGNFENVTSLEGLKWLLDEVWPQVARSQPEVQLHLAGHFLPKALGGERVVALGYVSDLDATFGHHRVFVSPVRFCTGIQTKVLGAVARGLPVVTTPAAAEGLSLQDEKQVLFARTPEEFAKQIKRLYCDEHLWRKLSQDGADFVKTYFSPERLAAQVRRVMERGLELKPKPYDAGHIWSVLRIEKEFPEILTGPSPERLSARIRAYCTLAELLLAEGETTVGLEQLRHVFSLLRGDQHRGPLFTRILLDLYRCYRKLGTSELPADFLREARVCLASIANSPPSSTRAKGAADSRIHYHLSPSSEGRGTRTKRSRPRGKKEDLMPAKVRCHILVIHEKLPHPDQNGCHVRLMQILHELLAQGHKLTYVARHGVGGERYAPPLQKLGIEVYSHDVERLRPLGFDAAPSWTLQTVLRQGRFDLAILFHWFWDGLSVSEQYLDDIRRFSPHTRVAILTDEQHGVRERRLAELSGLWTDLERACDLEQREFEAYRHADIVLPISESDQQGMLAAAPELETEILPMITEEVSSGPEFARRADIMFLGNFDNAANLEGLNWLLEEIWPRVAASLPQAQLHLAGHRLPEHLKGDRVVALGYVKDLDATFARHRVFASPVRFCTGVQTKVLGAVARGLPVVTTPAAARGLNFQNEKEVLIAATAEEFADQIIRLYCDQHLWQALSRCGTESLKSQFSRERLAAQVRRLTERVLELKPKPFDARHVWSALRVEKEFPEILTGPAPERLPSRIRAYCTLAELLLGEGNPSAALEQLRHVFSFMQGRQPQGPLFARILLDLDRCHRNLGTSEPPTDFVREARECLASGLSSPPSASGGEGVVDSGGHHPSPPSSERRRKQRARAQPDLSVIIPTYNRCAVLASCLAALEQQSLPKDRFEVIVVDDGSTDGTERLCQGLFMSFRLLYLRQVNAGAGAARKSGTEAARGEYLLLFNDDTIATPNLLEEHLRVQREHAHDKCAVLGHFRYPRQACKRALSSFFATRRFLFPQAFLQPGFYRESAYFIGCNLSIRREAVLCAGSFDPQFRVAEDTEIGVRLEQHGYGILYHPQALAWHDHLIFTAADLIERAHVYAPADILLFNKHPRLLASGRGPFGKLDADWAAKTKDSLEQSRRQVIEWTQAVARFDHLDFAPLFYQQNGGTTEAELVLKAFDQVVPQVYWFHLFERILELREKEESPSALSPNLSAIGSQPSVIPA